MVNQQKLDFLLRELPALLRKLHTNDKGEWGMMNAQQMTEHFILSVKNASGKMPHAVVTPAEHLDKFRSFLHSNKPFRENTKNPLIGDPLPVHYPSMEAAIDKLQAELNYFANVFQKDPGLTTTNPIFGELDFEANVQLLYKHALHHLRQFGIVPQNV
ncbi:MAG TPA: hypothetical protein VEB42_12880 [Chitinophagaceae bacterium]|nr:hypothetical protein [Chitinophagaceae bacterium]